MRNSTNSTGHWRVKVTHRSDRNDAARVEPGMAHIMVVLDVQEIDGLPDIGVLVERARIVPKSGVVCERPAVALEIPVIDGIKPHQGCEQTDFGFGPGHLRPDRVVG
jgi:hypothetical protein